MSHPSIRVYFLGRQRSTLVSGVSGGFVLQTFHKICYIAYVILTCVEHRDLCSFGPGHQGLNQKRLRSLA